MAGNLLPKNYLQRHAQVSLEVLGRLYRNPVSSLLTVAVIGITLALPTGLHLLLKNINTVRYSWESSVQASLFLAHSAEKKEALQLLRKIRQRDDVVAAHYISSAQALREFRKQSGFGHALDALQNNPLPAVIVVQPESGLSPEKIQSLVGELGASPLVAEAKMDQAWLRKLHAILDIVRRSVLVIAALLGIAVIIIVGNTIRLDIQNRREQIQVMKLLGAPDGFIRRPFLYTGLWYGFWGGILAWILVSLALWFLAGPVSRLAGLYNSQFDLQGLSFSGFLLLLVSGLVLGWLGSWWAVGRHLRAIQPS